MLVYFVVPDTLYYFANFHPDRNLLHICLVFLCTKHWNEVIILQHVSVAATHVDSIIVSEAT